MDAMWIFRDHSAKLYQFFNDFARVGGGCQRLRGTFSGNRRPKFLRPALRLPRDMAKSVTAPTYDRITFPRNGVTTAGIATMAIDDKTRTELEAAVFRRLVEHLRSRTDVQNIDMMNLAGFCRNCLSNWLKEAADAKGAAMSKDESREAVYGMPYETWKATHQGTASPEQLAAMKKVESGH
jgi:uncharacterized protein